jgi:hypothetical protein
MLRVWGRTSSGNVQKVMWAIGELGLNSAFVIQGATRGPVGQCRLQRLFDIAWVNAQTSGSQSRLPT